MPHCRDVSYTYRVRGNVLNHHYSAVPPSVKGFIKGYSVSDIIHATPLEQQNIIYAS